MQAATVLTPVPASQRIHNLDVLRGLALLGIALMNVEYFSASLLDVSEGIDPQARGLDRWADAFVYLFVRSKFWTLFSLLFGMGFAVMLERARVAGRGFVPLYLRRCLGLLAIGLVHYWLIWAGDILFSYALTALLLLALFRDTVPSRLWKWGLGIWAALVGPMIVASTAMLVAGGMAGPDAETAQATAALRDAEIAAYSSGSYSDATAVRLRFFMHALGFNVVLVPLVLGMFLVGAWLVRSGAMARPGGHRRLFVRLAWVGGIAGLALTLASLAVDPDPGGGGQMSARGMLAGSLHMAGAPLMSLAYIALVVLALERGAALLSVLAPAGRMALSNYIGQSVIGTLLFYGYGLGLWGEVGRAWQVLGVVAVFALQLAVSRWWLARFRYGPLEWGWRAFTYWQWPPLRRPAAAAGAG